MNKQYRKMIEQIAIDNEAYTDEQMKPVYKAQKTELDTIHAMLGVIFIKYGIDGFLKMNASQKANVNIKDMLKKMGKRLGDSEISKTTDILANVFKDTYYKNAYTMGKGMKIEPKFNMLKKEYIDAAVNTKYKEELFSHRIWTNKSDMIDKLQDGLIKAMNGETTIDKIAKDIKDTFNVTAYESQRLVHTENARVQTQASYDIGVSMGATQQMFSATLDMKTAEEDAGYDGILYDITDDSKPEIPLHPNCRCCYINVPFDGWSPTQRMDNTTKQNIDYVDYETWKENKNIK